MSGVRVAKGRLWLLLGLGAACDGNGGMEPPATRHAVAIHGGDRQFGAAGAELADPLQVLVRDTRSSEPAGRVAVLWRVVVGRGASVSPDSSMTDSLGIASTRLRLGPDTGAVQVEATVRTLVGEPAVFQLRAVSTPAITSISPARAAAGDTVRITGRDFSATAGDNTVLFGGMRGAVVSATSTQLVVAVPMCVPARTVSVTVQLGAVASGPVSFEVTSSAGPTLQLAVGQGRTFSDAAELACVRLPGGQANLSFLVVTGNASTLFGTSMPFQLLALAGQPTAPPAGPAAPLAAPLTALQPAASGPAALAWEARIRERERRLRPQDLVRPEPAAARPGAALAPPEIGDRRQFSVFNKEEKFVDVTAEVKFVSARAILYQDLNAPAGGFQFADFQRFGQLFDDPIYKTDVAVYGEPSDIDQNGQVIILFTPVVNELTPRGSSGFVAGFFFGFDLSTGSGSNRAEMFYSVVPDPQAQFSDARTTQRVLEVVPAVLAHELQHMIHFNQRVRLRNAAQESLWLSEALAHSAEDVVGDVFLERADTPNAVNFKVPNFLRAVRYLGDPTKSSLVTARSPGTLEERGAVWLLLKYATGHFGGNDLLRRLTQTTRSSTDNVSVETGRAWNVLLGDWAIAVWADDAPELQGAALEARFTFPNLNVRRVLGQFSGGFPLKPAEHGFQDVTVTDTLPASSPQYVILRATTPNPSPLNLNLAGTRGAAFPADARAQLSILRFR